MPPSPFGHLNVLIVDDEHFVRRMEQRVCEALGVASVHLACDGYDAVAQAHAADPPFDVIVCDLNMPGLDGIETLRHLAHCRPGAGIIIASAVHPLVLQTVGDLVKARGLQLLGCLSKPMAVSTLTPMLEHYVTHHAPPGRRPVAVTPEDLERGIRAGEIVPFYQPKVSLTSNALCGVEALARWRHPEHGVLPPGIFLPVAERHGLMNEVTESMLTTAIAEAGAWTAAGRAVELAVNVAPHTLERLDLPDRIFTLAARSGLPLERLVVEITETGMVEDHAAMLEVITRLGVRGVRLSIDDFGTGYSSMQRLVRLPFSELKLDRTFVAGAVDDERIRVVLEANLTMAKRLDLRVVAEGIETAEQRALVRELGCDLAQGFLFAHPMSHDDLWAWEARMHLRPAG